MSPSRCCTRHASATSGSALSAALWNSTRLWARWALSSCLRASSSALCPPSCAPSPSGSIWTKQVITPWPPPPGQCSGTLSKLAYQPS